jgi:hypothetical protein
MTDLIRKAGRFIVLAFLMYLLAIFVVGIVVAAFMGLVAASGGDVNVSPVLLGAAVIMMGTLGVIIWLFRDARATQKKGHPFQKKNRPRPGPDGDMSDVAGIPHRDPWLG